MFDIGWPELMVVMIIALIVIGPKDLPAALKQLGKWVGAARRMSSEFQKHVDDIVRESELEDVKRGIDRARSVNIKRELEKQIDPDGSLNKAFGGSVGSKSPGKSSGTNTDGKSWRSSDGTGGAIEKPSTPKPAGPDNTPLSNSATADALANATNKGAPASVRGGGGNGSRHANRAISAGDTAPARPSYASSGPDAASSPSSGPKSSASPAEPIKTDQA